MNFHQQFGKPSGFYFSFLVITIFIAITQTSAQNSKLSIWKEPGWITTNALNYSSTNLEKDAEDGYLDVAFEKQVSLPEQSKYYKSTIKILSEAGVQNGSEISVNFDPSYQQLIFHKIRIIRDGQSFNKLQLSDFKIIQQEKELDRHMYDGSLTAFLVLDDVRSGDIIESSYTLKGFNPILDNKYADVYTCRFGAPVQNLFYKLITPAERDILIKNSETNIEPVVTKKYAETVYEWKLENVSALHLESETPDWFDPFARIMVSEFKNWGEVGTWASALFPRNLKLSPSLLKEIRDIKEKCVSNEARTLKALRFVQENVRYMGIEIGVQSHKPTDPNKIFNQRFGDCKDKSYLLVTMLNAMGIEANPVLVNTNYKNTIKNQLPSPFAFDHCTVQVKVNDRIYWFDPTISFQRGAIGDIAYPDYQTGIVVNELTNGLTQIPFHENGFVDIKEIFDIPKKFGSAKLKVTTKYTGSFADETRSDYNNNSLYEIKNRCKDYYAKYFDKITADSLTYNDNEATGAFTTVEYYTINNIWENDGKKKISVSPFVINGVMSKPSDKNRSMPFYLAYPAHYKEQIEVNMPEDWPVKGHNDNFNCKGFAFTSKGESEGNKVTYNYEYENLKDNVMPEEAASFFSAYEYAYKNTDYELFYDTNYTTSQTSYSNSSSTEFLASVGIFPKLYTLLGMAVLITYFVRQGKSKAR